MSEQEEMIGLLMRVRLRQRALSGFTICSTEVGPDCGYEDCPARFDHLHYHVSYKRMDVPLDELLGNPPPYLTGA